MTRCPTCGELYADGANFCPRDGARLFPATPRKSSGGRKAGRSTRFTPHRQGLEDSVPDLVPGQRVDGRYEVVRKLGEGGMSSVYLVRDVATGDRYAMKVLTDGLSLDQGAMARLRREASFGMRLAHPHVCHILRLGETATGIVYVVMPYLQGEVLSDRLFNRGTVALAEAVRLVRDIATGLHVAHGLGIVHRDLKPENVMLCHGADGGEVAVVMDFGLAKERRADAELQKLTATGVILGTPEFMSPEQIRGRNLDARSDVYALGVMTVEMLTGKLPFAGTTAQEVMIARLRGEPLGLRQLRPELEVPVAVEQAIRRALAADPEARFQTAPAYADALRDAAERRPAVAGVRRLSRWFGRRRAGEGE